MTQGCGGFCRTPFLWAWRRRPFAKPGPMRSALRHVLPLLPGRMAFASIGFAIAVSAALIATGPTYLDPRSLLPTALRVLALVALAGLVMWRPGLTHPFAQRLVALFIGIGFLIVGWDAVRLLNHTTMAIPLPLTDDLLDGWDRALGFDWRAYFDAVAAWPLLRDAMAWSYTSLTFLSVAAYLVMSLTQDRLRALFFLETFSLTAVFCTTVGALFPARAAVERYFGATAVFPDFPLEPGLYHLASLERLRTGEPVELVLGQLPGLVTFPSFHTAAGVLLAMACWRCWMFLPAALYAALMIASTPVFGGHYFIDLIAGTLVAVVIALFWARLDRFRPLFARRARV